MNKWKNKIIGELGFTFTGLSGKTAKDFGKGKPYIPYMNIFSNSKIDTTFLEYVKINSFERQNTVKKGDLFFTTSSETVEEVGMTSVLLDDIEECYLNSFCFGFRLYNYDDLLPEFVPYLFRGEEVRKMISLLGRGSTRYNLPKTELLNRLQLNLPPLPTQRKIAHILSAADAVIEKTQAAIAKYKAIKQGMLHDLFTRGIDLKTGNLRPKQQDAPQLYKESKLGWIPKEWNVEKIGGFSFITKLAGFEYTIHFDYSKSGPIIAVRALNIKQGKLNLFSIHTIPKETSDALPRSQLKKGDLVISYVGTVGQVAVIPESSKFHLAPNVAKISVDIKEINPFYLNQFLNSDIGQNEIIKLVSSTTQAALSMQNLREVLFIKPDLKEQDLIKLNLENIDNKIQTEQTYLHKLQQIKAGLMADLLSGKKEVIVEEEMAN